MNYNNNNNNNRINEEMNINTENNNNNNDLTYDNLISPSPLSPKLITAPPQSLIQLQSMNMNIPPPQQQQTGTNPIQLMPLINQPNMIQQQNIRLNPILRGTGGG